MAEHCINLGQHIQFQATSILTKKYGYMKYFIREVIKTGLHRKRTKEGCLHIDSTVPKFGLFRATLHTAPMRVTFRSFLADPQPSTLSLPAALVAAGRIH
jgi:hypothetical protein